MTILVINIDFIEWLVSLSRTREIVVRVGRRNRTTDILLAELALIASYALAIEVAETLRELTHILLTEPWERSYN